jgi:signal peptidase I
MMNSEAASDNAVGHDTKVYQAAAREAWRADGATGMLRLTVASDSMRPLLRAGDGVVVQPIDPYALQPGDVIVAQRSGEWITHRLVAVDERGWHMHGDNTRYGDEAASASEIVGRVIAIERGAHTIDLQQPRWHAIGRRINRVQRVQLKILATMRGLGGTRSNGAKRALAALINWPFQVMVRVIIRS